MKTIEKVIRLCTVFLSGSFEDMGIFHVLSLFLVEYESKLVTWWLLLSLQQLIAFFPDRKNYDFALFNGHFVLVLIWK